MHFLLKSFSITFLFKKLFRKYFYTNTDKIDGFSTLRQYSPSYFLFVFFYLALNKQIRHWKGLLLWVTIQRMNEWMNIKELVFILSLFLYCIWTTPDKVPRHNRFGQCQFLIPHWISLAYECPCIISVFLYHIFISCFFFVR